MAGIDYLKCEKCGERLAYDGDECIRDQIYMTTDYIYCAKCVKRLFRKIERLQKHDRRKH